MYNKMRFILSLLLTLMGIQTASADPSLDVTWNKQKSCFEIKICFYDDEDHDACTKETKIKVRTNTGSEVDLLYLDTSHQSDDNEAYSVNVKKLAVDNGDNKYGNIYAYTDTRPDMVKMGDNTNITLYGNNVKKSDTRCYAIFEWYPPKMFQNNDLAIETSLTFHAYGTWNINDLKDKGIDIYKTVSTSPLVFSYKSAKVNSLDWSSDLKLAYNVSYTVREHDYNNPRFESSFIVSATNINGKSDEKEYDVKESTEGQIDILEYFPSAMSKKGSALLYTRIFPSKEYNGGLYYTQESNERDIPIATTLKANSLTSSIDNNKITLSWETVSTSSERLNLYLAKNDGALVAIKEGISSTTTSYIYTVPAEDIALTSNSSNYTFVLKNAEYLDLKDYKSTSHTDLMQTLAMNGVKTYIDQLSNLTASFADGVLYARWDVDCGMVPDRSKYKVNVTCDFLNSEHQSKPSVTMGEDNASAIISGLEQCEQFVLKVTSTYDGNTVSDLSTSTMSRPYYEPGDISDLIVSKGYYNDRVVLSWKVLPGPGEFSHFKIYRNLITNLGKQEMGVEIAKISTNQTNNYSYTDEDKNLLPGEYYYYTVAGYSVCGEQEAKSKMESSVGFCMPYGTVTGNITYLTSGGTAAPGVDVVATSTEKNISNKSINSSGSSLATTDGIPEVSIDNGWAYQFFAKDINNSGKSIFFSEKPYLDIRKKTDSYGMVIKLGNDKSNYVTFSTVNDSVFNATDNNQITISMDDLLASQGSAAIHLYVDSINIKLDKSVTGTPDFNSWKVKPTLTVGTEMDELRIWDTSLTQDAVKQNYDRFITGSETGLVGYYRFDEPAGQMAFDLSKIGETFNMNDLKFTGQILRANSSVRPDQLAMKATTDLNGFYKINSLPYSGDGSPYTFTPMKGTHVFEPKNTTIDVGKETFNSLNFIDNSSFNIPVKVFYANTDLPVEGVSFLVDNVECMSKANSAILTNKSGEATIQVPIGYHHIKVQRNRHVFRDEGYVFGIDPATGDPVTQLFENDRAVALEIADSTLVTIAGRVAGGSVEYEKPVGFGLSKANLGQATIILKPQAEGYKMNTRSEAYTFTKSLSTRNDSINSTATVGSKDNLDECFRVTIKTDAKTGEFSVLLPPVKYQVTEVKISNEKDYNQLSFSQDFNASTDEDKERYYDVEGDLYTFSYSNLLKVQYAPLSPTMTVTPYDYSKMEVMDYFGEDSCEVYDKQGIVTDKIPVYDKTNKSYVLGSAQHPFCPVFLQNKVYAFKVEGYEEYVYDGIVDKVYLEGVQLTIDNKIGNKAVLTEPSTPDGKFGDLIDVTTLDPAIQEALSEAYLSQDEMKLDSLGAYVYMFRAGFPNVVEGSDNTWPMSIIYDYNGASITWDAKADLGDDFRGVVLGNVPEGTNFVTAGPITITDIIRDPAGSESYCSLMNGSVDKQEVDFTIGDGENIEASLYMGSILESIMATCPGGVGVVMRTSVTTDNGGGGSLDLNLDYNGKWIWTTTATETISTSGDDQFVGAAGDVFIGSSTNIVFGKAQSLLLTTINQKPVLRVASVSTAEQQAETSFAYPQNHIVNTLMPQILDLRNELITVDSEKFYAETVVNTGTEPCYYSAITPAHKDFGKDGTYRFVPANNGKSQTDMVSYYNMAYANWEAALAQNEKEKHLAFETYPNDGSDEHIQKWSLAGGVTYDHSLSEEAEDADGFTFDGSLQIYAGVEFELETLAKAKFNLKSTVRPHVKLNFDETDTNTKTYAYHLQDNGRYDTHNIWVYPSLDEDDGEFSGDNKAHKRNGHGPIFRTIAGQTSCPYEEAEISRYAKDDNGNPCNWVLSNQTVAIEKPQLVITPIKNTQIAKGDAASYKLLISNATDVDNANVTFQLGYLESTNPDGAQLFIDGKQISISQPMEFVLAKGDVIEKTMTLRQGNKKDVFDFEGITIVLHSTCQWNADIGIPDIESTADIEAHFIPGCSPLSLNIDDSLLNSSDIELDESGITHCYLPVTVDGYTLGYDNMAGIDLQYCSEGGEWRTFKQYTTDADRVSGDVELLGETISFDFDMIDMNDGDYQFCAVSQCSSGSAFIPNESNVVTVQKYTKRPLLEHLPSPSNGILQPGDEISVEFSKPINSNAVHTNNISVTGLLNGYKTDHSVGLNFNGETSASTESKISTNSSYSIEGWVKRVPGQAGTLFYYGNDANNMSLGFNASDKLVLSVGNSTYESHIDDSDKGWQYIGVAYDVDTRTYTVQANGQTVGNQTVITATPAETAITEGYLYIGNDRSGANGMVGQVTGVHMWDKVRQCIDMAADCSVAKVGTEPGLIGYWNLEEGEGITAADLARSRTMTVNTDWYVSPSGKSLKLTDNSLSIPASTFPFNSDKNFTWEMWMLAEDNDCSILSAGNIGIKIDASGSLVLHIDSIDTTIPNTDAMDGKWHHVAMTVDHQNKNGKTMFYVDGVKKLETAASAVSAIKSMTYESNIKGYIDEIRIWESALSLDEIKLNKNNKLRGTETGLKAYYPFEEYVEQTYGDIAIETSLKDMVLGNTAQCSGTPLYSDYTATIKDVKPVEDVGFTFTVSDTKLIITLTEPLSRIEGCNLTACVSEIKDNYGNYIASPIRWTMYVDQNTLKWDEDLDEFNIKADYGEPCSFSSRIVNSGGDTENYTISGMPAWLSCDAVSGSLGALDEQEISFTVMDGLPIGRYEAVILLTGNDDVSEKLVLNLKVTGKAPDWSVNSNLYESSMTVRTKVKLRGLYVEDEDDIIGAFVNGECRGVASPTYSASNKTYLTNIHVYGNTEENGDTVVFRYWDASTATTYPVVYYMPKEGANTSDLLFALDSYVGTTTEPALLDAQNFVEMSIDLPVGYSWLSANVANSKSPLIGQFQKSVGTSAISLKDKVTNKSMTYSDGVWTNNITDGWNNLHAYEARMNREATVTFVGEPVDPTTPIAIAPAADTYIPYLPQTSMKINDALASVDTDEDDMVSTRDGFVANLGNGVWYGTLDVMEPGSAYKYHNSNADKEKTLAYPSTNPMTIVRTSVSSWRNSPHYWATDHTSFGDMMLVMARVFINGEELKNEEYEVAAFDGDGRCRGNVRLIYVPHLKKHVAFLLLHGDDREVLNLRLYNHATQHLLNVESTILYRPNERTGKAKALYFINFVGDAAVKDISTVGNIRSVDVLNLSGSFILRKTSDDGKMPSLPIPSGVYILKVTGDNGTVTTKFVKSDK